MEFDEKVPLTIEELIARLRAVQVLLGSGVGVKCSLQFNDRSTGRTCKFGSVVDVSVDSDNKILRLVAEERW